MKLKILLVACLLILCQIAQAAYQIDVLSHDDPQTTNYEGALRVIADGNTGPYTVTWPDNTTSSIDVSTGIDYADFANLSAGTYTVKIENAHGCEIYLDETIISESPFEIELTVFLEGAYNSTTGEMKAELKNRFLLPGMMPLDLSGQITPPGHPYAVAPWNYMGNEGSHFSNYQYDSIQIAHNADIIDWVLLSFREDVLPNSTTDIKTVGLVLENGKVALLTSPFTTSNPISHYVVVQHRNHMPVMSTIKITTANMTHLKVCHDLTTQNSYDKDGFGQKEVSPGIWCMYAGDFDQAADLIKGDINGVDRLVLETQNGLFNQYLSGDGNLDGEATGLDKIFWNPNNGIYSGVIK